MYPIVGASRHCATGAGSAGGAGGSGVGAASVCDSGGEACRGVGGFKRYGRGDGRGGCGVDNLRCSRNGSPPCQDRAFLATISLGLTRGLSEQINQIPAAFRPVVPNAEQINTGYEHQPSIGNLIFRYPHSKISFPSHFVRHG